MLVTNCCSSKIPDPSSLFAIRRKIEEKSSQSESNWMGLELCWWHSCNAEIFHLHHRHSSKSSDVNAKQVATLRGVLMPQSHWAFLASPMQSQWKLTSIRLCSGDIINPSANNLNSWYSWGSISPMPKIFNACFEIFRKPLTMFCREKCSANIRWWSAINRGIFAEQLPNIRRTNDDCATTTTGSPTEI